MINKASLGAVRAGTVHEPPLRRLGERTADRTQARHRAGTETPAGRLAVESHHAIDLFNALAD